jgi:cyclophilin family peptidyl-prolyl cis-trans isomerase
MVAYMQTELQKIKKEYILQPQISKSSLRIGLLFVTLLLVLVAAACGGTAPAEPAAPAAETPAPATAAEPAPITADGAAAQLSPVERNNMYDAPPAMVIDPGQYYYATLRTEKGDIRVQLFADRAPVTVNNFVFLAREGFYDNTTFHRVLEGFMAQAGDPTGTGAGGPGYRFQDEIVPGLTFDQPGLLAMANAGPGTNGSQFFITFEAVPWLDGRHTIFGEVLEGQEVLDQLTRRDPQTAPTTDGDLLLTVDIEEDDTSVLPTPTPAPPTPTPTPTPTPFAPSSLAPDDLTAAERPLANLPMEEKSHFFNTPPEMVIDPARNYTAVIVTSNGEIVVRLYADLAPVAVNNFVLIASLGFYDGTPINDVSEEGVIIGAPLNHPSSYVGYYVPGEIGTTMEWGAGAVGYLPALDPMTGEWVSNGSQLIILAEPLPFEITEQFSFFGEVVEGIEILNELTFDDTIESIQIEVSEE